MSDARTNIARRCRLCEQVFFIKLVYEEYERWKRTGGPIEAAMPYLEADDILLLVVGLCDTCSAEVNHAREQKIREEKNSGA